MSITCFMKVGLHQLLIILYRTVGLKDNSLYLLYPHVSLGLGDPLQWLPKDPTVQPGHVSVWRLLSERGAGGRWSLTAAQRCHWDQTAQQHVYVSSQPGHEAHLPGLTVRSAGYMDVEILSYSPCLLYIFYGSVCVCFPQGCRPDRLRASGFNREDTLSSCPQLRLLSSALRSSLVWVRFVLPQYKLSLYKRHTIKSQHSLSDCEMLCFWNQCGSIMSNTMTMLFFVLLFSIK